MAFDNYRPEVKVNVSYVTATKYVVILVAFLSTTVYTPFAFAAPEALNGTTAPTTSSNRKVKPGLTPEGTITPPPTTPTQKSLLNEVQDAFTTIAESVEPTVVNIKAAHISTDDPSIQDIPGIPELPIQPEPSPTPAPKGTVPKGQKPQKKGVPNFLFPLPIVPKGESDAPPLVPRRSYATGSGVIVRSDGYILTNDHVVQGAIGGEVTVTLYDGREFRGKVFEDFRSDLAIVKIDPGPEPLFAASFAPSSSVEPGQWAIAVGSPFDLENTMTVGVISALGRHQQIGSAAQGERRYYPELIQTDAAINPGNSGGPLFNIDGKVVGINVAIESPVEASAGVGFAIPSDAAQRVMKELIDKGKVVRGFLGVAPENMTPALTTEFGVKEGAFVRDVTEDGPAGSAGLDASDIITAFNGKPIVGEVSLREAIAEAAPDSKALIAYVRGQKPGSITVTIGAAPDETPKTAPVKIDAPTRASLGLAVRDVTPRDRTASGFPPTTDGAYVEKVTRGGSADYASIAMGVPLQGSVIQSVGDVPVHNTKEFEAALAPTLTGTHVTIVVLYGAEGHLHQSALTIDL